jgi:hypothetical protein
MGSRIGRPEKPAGLPILLAILVAQLAGTAVIVAFLFWLATATQSAP